MSVKDNIFKIHERVKDKLYYIYFTRKGFKTQSLGYTVSQGGATKRTKTFAKRNNIVNYIIMYTEEAKE